MSEIIRSIQIGLKDRGFRSRVTFSLCVTTVQTNLTKMAPTVAVFGKGRIIIDDGLLVWIPPPYRQETNNSPVHHYTRRYELANPTSLDEFFKDLEFFRIR